MVTFQLTYIATLRELPGVVTGFEAALDLSPEDAFDILAAAASTANAVVMTVTDAAFGRLVATCSVALDMAHRDAFDRGNDLLVETLNAEPDESVISFHIAESY